MSDQATLCLNAELASDRDLTCRLLQAGELVALPTETVYGLAADAAQPEAVNKIFIAKNRPATHPLIVHIASVEKLSDWVSEIPPAAKQLAEAFWPGPLTMLFHKSPRVNQVVTGGLDTIAIRVPQHPVFLGILEKLNTGLAAPSANPHKQISPTTAQHVLKGLSGKIAAVLDGGPCSVGLESTILDLTTPVPRILRPGPITPAMIEAVLQTPIESPATHHEPVPGNMAEHYQPKTPAFMMTHDELKTYLAQSHQRIGLLFYSPDLHNDHTEKSLQLPKEKSAYAKQLYQALHDLDQNHIDEILIEAPPQSPEWQDVWDRLLKATSSKEGK